MKKHKYVDPIEWAEKQNKKQKNAHVSDSPISDDEPVQLAFEPKRDPHHLVATVGVIISLVVIAVIAWVVTRNDDPYESRITSEVSLAGPLTSEVETDEQESNSLLEQTTYPASGQNPAYSMLFAAERVATCDDATGTCGPLIGNLGGSRDIQILMQSASLNPSAQAPQDDGQCLEIEPSRSIDTLVYICQTGSPSAGVLYYSFELDLNSQRHFGIFTGVNPTGQRFADVSTYENELYEIIDSIQLR